MTMDSTHDRTSQLRQWMQQAGFSSFKALSQAAGVSDTQIRNLRQGKLATIRLESVIKLCQALQVSIAEFMSIVGYPHQTNQDVADSNNHSPNVAELRQEYDRLHAKLTQHQQELQHQFQYESLQVLESLLLQLPTALYAAQQNPQLPAVKLVPLLRPIEQLLQQWGIEAIAAVGTEVEYDPQQHQLLEGSAIAGDRVRVRYVGYRQGDRLLYRAKVSPIL